MYTTRRQHLLTFIPLCCVAMLILTFVLLPFVGHVNVWHLFAAVPNIGNWHGLTAAPTILSGRPRAAVPNVAGWHTRLIGPFHAIRAVPTIAGGYHGALPNIGSGHYLTVVPTPNVVGWHGALPHIGGGH